MLSYIPGIIFVWFFGMKPGLIATFIILVDNMICFHMAKDPLLVVKSYEPVIGIVSHLVIVIIFGFIRELVVKLKHEIASRKIIEEELKKHKEHLEELVKERKNELETINEQLRQTEKLEALGQLTGGIAHDFNNMLGGIIGFAELAKRKFAKDNPKLKQYLNTILSNSDQAGSLIAKLLAFARKGKYRVEPVDMHQTVTNVLNLMTHSIDPRIELINDLRATNYTVMGDQSQLQNVILDIGINARDAMPEGGRLTISTDMFMMDESYIKTHSYKLDTGEYLKITITDTGAGMTKEIKKKIFEPFFTTKEIGKGTGMGLASAYGSVKSHNGSIEVYSEPGHGTSFKLYFPFASDNEKKTRETSEIIIRGSATIMLIEDDKVLREASAEMLKDLDFIVITCNDGVEGIKSFKTYHEDIDVVILDVVMPKMDGYTCFLELQRIDPNLKVIISSGFSINDNIKQLIDKGAIGFLQKPFNTRKLLKTIKKATHNN